MKSSYLIFYFLLVLITAAPPFRPPFPSNTFFRPPLESTAPSATVGVNIDLAGGFLEWDHYWENCVGSGHATLSLRQDWRSQLQQAHTELGFQQVRFHGLLDDDMSVLLYLNNGQPTYSFFNVDQSYSYLLNIGMKPLVELSFMPKLLASGNSTIFHYEAQTSPPSDYDLWYDLIKTLTQHLVDKFGIDEIRQWNFEVWNEPNCGFWSSTEAEYYKLYNYTAHALKSVDSKIRVGGPATCMSGWITNFLDYCSKNSIPVDFVSTHQYPTDIEPAQVDAMYQSISGALSEVEASDFPDLPLYYTEYNDGLFEYYPLYSYTPEHDEPYAAAFAIKNIFDISALNLPLLSWWTFSDIFEEGGQDSQPFHGGFGMMTIHSIPKPSWRAFQLLHLSGTLRFSDVSLSSTSSLASKTVGAFATFDEATSEIMVFVYNHNVVNGEIEPEEVTLTLSNVSSLSSSSIIGFQKKGFPSKTQTKGAARMYIIDDNHCNPKKLWQEMGSPEYPTDSQISALLKASEFTPDTLGYNFDLDNLSFDTFLALPQSVIVIQLNVTSIFS